MTNKGKITKQNNSFQKDNTVDQVFVLLLKENGERNNIKSNRILMKLIKS